MTNNISETPGPDKSVKSENTAAMVSVPALRRYLVTTAALHLVWEFVHMPLYTLWSKGTVGDIAFAAVHCTGGDILIGMSVLLVAILTVNKPWPTRSAITSSVGAITLVLGVCYTVFSEWLNIVVRQSWQYADAMPIVPLIDTGLSPLAQWIVVPAIALWWSSKLSPKS